MHICIKVGIAATLIVLSPLLLGNTISGLSGGGQQVSSTCAATVMCCTFSTEPCLQHRLLLHAMHAASLA